MTIPSIRSLSEHYTGLLLLRQLKNIALAKRKIDVYRAESPRNFEPDRATLSVAQGVPVSA